MKAFMASQAHSTPAPPHPWRRMLLVAGLLGMMAFALLARAVDLQVVKRTFLQQQGDARFLRKVSIPVSRGSIFDRNGVPLAVSTPVDSLWTNPTELLQHAGRIPELAKALGVNSARLQRRLEERANRDFVYLRRMMSPQDAQLILKLDIPGVYKQREYRRYYPSGEVSAHVIGFTNIDDHGQEGLELAYDNWLSGQPGLRWVIRDRLGQAVESMGLIREAVPGHNLTVSLDSRIQYLAFRELSKAVLDHQAKSGSMVVMNVRNGEILAMVNVPSYNPNDVAASSASARRNRAVTDVFEPGSVMKAFTIAAALKSGRWTPTTPINTSPGWYMLDGYKIKDDADYGRIDVTKVVTFSSNVGASHIALSLPDRSLYDSLRSFGFGHSTGSGFPGEASGLLPPYQVWRPIRKATISYGYGLNVTALQLAQAYAAIADNGVLHRPSFILGEDGPPVRILSRKLDQQLINILKTVVTPDGTGERAAIPNYTVAGKTGTAHIADGGGYHQHQYNAVFVGMAPASEPRLVAVVVVHDPTRNGFYGGLVAAPVFRSVMSSALRLMDIPPDHVKQWYADLPKPTSPVPAQLVSQRASKSGEVAR